MLVAVVALLALLLGVVLAAVVALWVIVSQLADLKAYTMTTIQYLQEIVGS